MGLMDKFKNLFTEEIEEEERPIKKEVRHVEIPSPKRAEVNKPADVNNISDSNVITKEEKVITPVYFDDKDFDDLEKPKEKIKEKPTIKREEKPKLYNGSKIVEEKKQERVVFKPSPIISPVYGILDKNYFKEDISTTKSINQERFTRKSSDKVTIDDVRNKAYGTLEDELKENLLLDDYNDFDNKSETDNAIDVLEELNFSEIDENEDIKLTDRKVNSLLLEDLDLDDDTELLAKQLEEQNRKLEEINQMIDNDKEDKIEVEEQEKIQEPIEKIQEEKLIIEEKKEEINNDKSKKTKEEKPKRRSDRKEKTNESLTDSELFDLVDSMYDEKGE